MGSCLSKQQAAAVTASQANSSAVEAAVPDIKAQAPEHGAARADPAAVKGKDSPAETPSEKDEEYTGAIAPICELQRRQHLNNLGTLYTVSLQLDETMYGVVSYLFGSTATQACYAPNMQQSSRRQYRSVHGNCCTDCPCKSTLHCHAVWIIWPDWCSTIWC
jgi:hypothetical protein